jgi:two-component system, cell cycle sensor histidine kinase and response regulator CckA
MSSEASELERLTAIRYGSLFDNMREGLAHCRIVRVDGRVVDLEYLAVNAAHARLTGLEDVVGKRISAVIPGVVTSTPKMLEFLDRVVTTGTPERVEAYVAGLDRWMAISAFTPGPEHVVVLFDDVSPGKRAAATLREYEERYRALFERSYDIVYVHDMEGRFVDANAAALDLLGYDRAEIPSLTLASLIGPAQFPLAQQTIAELIATGRQKQPTHFRVRTREGRYVDLETSAAVIYRGGAPWAVQGVARDITARKQAEEALRLSEERFRTLVESMEDWVETVDRDGRVTRAPVGHDGRPGAGVTARLGETAAESLGLEAAAAHDAAHARVLAGEHVVYEWSLVRPGEVRAMQTSASALRDSRGQVVGAVRVSRDITEEKKLYEQLLLSERMSSMGMVAAGVVHEINNALAAVMANLDFGRRALGPLREGAPGLAEPLDALQDAAEAVEQARQVVRDLKVFSRAREERPGPVDVRQVLESAVRMVWNELRHRAALRRDYREAPAVMATEARLAQVFLNLLVNAAQAIPEGHADEHAITLRVGTDASGCVLVEVQDSGCGIAAEVRPRVFDGFFTTKPAGVGCGLGLSISQRIVAELGGQITVASQEGKGSTFRVTLPPATAAAPAEAARPLQTPVPAWRGRLLVVDDNPAVAHGLERVLGQFHKVTTAASGQEALAALQGDATFDIILCDVMMPEMTGIELHEELRSTAPALAERMVFLTGGAFTPGTRAALDRLPNECLDKPVDSRSLLKLVDRWLKARGREKPER